MKIALIGTGNVATVLGKMLHAAGMHIVQVYGRTLSAAVSLGTMLDAETTDQWSSIRRDADVYIVALSDRALPELSEHFRLSGQVVLHTAGSVPAKVLNGISENYGVFYPLQSLRKNMPVLTEIPFLAEANGVAATEVLNALAMALQSRLYFVSEAERLRLHLAAVFVNNFCNHLYALAADFCTKEQIDFSMLQPIALETATRLQTASPLSVVTGPAIRNDVPTIERHLSLLTNHFFLQKVYLEMTESIQQFYKSIASEH